MMTETHVDPVLLTKMAGTATDIADQLLRTRRTVDGSGTPSLPSWETAAALAESRNQWKFAVKAADKDWREFADNLKDGLSAVASTDQANGDDLAKLR